MTLGEFLDPVHKGTHQARVLAVLYYYERYQSQSALTVDDIRDALKRARVRRAAKVNVADVLAKAGACVDTVGTKGTKKLWSLTETGRRTVRETLGLPAADIEVEHDVGTLE